MNIEKDSYWANVKRATEFELDYMLSKAGTVSYTHLMSCCSNDLTEKVYSSITQDSYEYTVKDFKSVVSSVYSPLRGAVSYTHLE